MCDYGLIIHKILFVKLIIFKQINKSNKSNKSNNIEKIIGFILQKINILNL